MIRKSIYASLIIVFIFGVCLTEQLLSKEYLKTMDEKTTNIISVLSTTDELNSENIYSLTDDLSQYWQKKEPILCTFINYKEIEDVGVEISRLKIALNNSNRDLYEESINLIKFYIKNYENIFGINFQNIF